jgi:hypothetical protein
MKTYQQRADRSAAARKAWRTRKANGTARRTLSQKLDDARGKVEQWTTTAARALDKVQQWKRIAARLERRIEREQAARLPLLVEQSRQEPEPRRLKRKYSAGE